MTTWMDKGIRDEVDMAQFVKPDPRDARIAELEEALRDIRTMLLDDQEENPTYAGAMAMAVIGIVLMPSPERDMTITREELPA